MFYKKPKKSDKGFTLIELMIVIAIIGILAAIAIPNFLSYRERAYNSTAKADIKNCLTAAQTYYMDEPNEEITLAYAKSCGFTQTDNVTISVKGGQSKLEIQSTHQYGTLTYKVHQKASGLCWHED